jgi:drug/metabolite transporter (DMT)-like permease
MNLIGMSGLFVYEGTNLQMFFDFIIAISFLCFLIEYYNKTKKSNLIKCLYGIIPLKDEEKGRYNEHHRGGVFMYYALIILSVVMFGGCFALNDVYRKLRGSSIKISLQFSLVGSLAGFVVLTIANGFRIEFTPFTFLIALFATVNSFLFTFCSFKALDSINLSLYSLFSMLGGMVLPFLQGILFYGEKITIAKGLCFVFITFALLLTVEKGERKSGAIYYACIFVLNGMAGVLSKIFAEAKFEKTSAIGYTNLISICSVVISSVLLFTVFRKKSGAKEKACAGMAIGATAGMINRIANLILVSALAHVEASVQYPVVTGGVMIVSTLICFFGKNKPSKKEVLSIVIAFIGLLILFAIPV